MDIIKEKFKNPLLSLGGFFDDFSLSITFLLFPIVLNFGCTPRFITAQLAASSIVQSPATHTDYIKNSTTPSLSNYTGQAFAVQPGFSVLDSSTNIVDYSFSGTLVVQANSDGTCSTKSTGSLVSAEVPWVSGTASFSTLAYSLSTVFEESIYLSASSNSLSLCMNAIDILHYFRKGYGYRTYEYNGLGSGGAALSDTQDRVSAVHVDSLGRYVAVGQSNNAAGTYEMAIWRYNPDGSSDTTFGSGGVVTFRPGGLGAAGASNASKQDLGKDFQIDSLGRYVIVGASVNSVGTFETTLWRYKSDGTPDTTFSSSGAVTFQPGGLGAAGASNAAKNDQGLELQIDSQGYYVIGGSSNNSVGTREVTLWRYSSNGTPDTTFSSSGAVMFQPGGLGAAGASNASKYDTAEALQIDSSGRYVLVGESKNTAGGYEMAIWRYNSNGTPDTSFSSSGAVMFQPGGLGAAGASNTLKNDFAFDFKIDSQSRYVMVGSSTNTAFGDAMTIWRYNSNGTPDTTFSSSGAVVFQKNGLGAAGASNSDKSDAASALQIDSVGRYVIGGGAVNPIGRGEMVLLRYNSDGTPDTTFSSSGVVVFQPSGFGAAGASNASKYDTGNALQIDLQGRYVMVGGSYNSAGGKEIAIWRYLSSGLLDQ